ncbi:SDR family NAD(P)-dependent oxidoreductase [Sansalvadorimonas verongulae]|uniref:SDR family NAD(P)-dependent oxidoreductase n=1 Tax=Sansalvadorimonas verongulae TaxID=2172824 RepID=UPI0012BCB659|nr:SDR family oxidoreductase [Sansalvadorimonas verongulae]MTI12715.1 SDR family oxidoreductase [Sansalvadorimonas verongulae]
MPTSLKSAVVAITGAGSGIGRALAIQCAREGAIVAISDISEKPLQETAELCRAYGRDVSCKIVDVSKRDEIYNWADQTVERFGRVNVIINNAGVNLNVCVASMTDCDFEWQMDINFWGVTHGTRAFLPHLKKAEWGHIVNVSSLFGLISMPNQSAYNASKFAVRGFSESLRMELMLEGCSVSVSCVHPGGIKTNIVNSSRILEQVGPQLSEEQQKNEFNKKLAKTTPEKAAQIILTGMKKNKSRILVGTDAKVIDLVQRFLPTKYQVMVIKALELYGHQMRKAQYRA